MEEEKVETEGGDDGTEHKFSYKIFNPTREEISASTIGRMRHGPLFRMISKTVF